ncbi:Zn-ribbon domain-containing OB-fold protein [Caballeronia catudaia]|uniref:Zn-ribbon domain-containing OB-fold protein n=1 Tax=Caballeronia catudaia TaxID=1777136 RepID=UPI00117DAB1E
MENSKPVRGLYDEPMWKSMESGVLELQRCESCAQFRYPPASHCPNCLSDQTVWERISGGATILSWVVFRRQYFGDHPTPCNSIAVELDEGPILITQLVGTQPESSWIGERVQIEIYTHNGRKQHGARLANRFNPGMAAQSATLRKGSTDEYDGKTPADGRQT